MIAIAENRRQPLHGRPITAYDGLTVYSGVSGHDIINQIIGMLKPHRQADMTILYAKQCPVFFIQIAVGCGKGMTDQ